MKDEQGLSSPKAVRKQNPDFRCISTSCRQQWLYQTGEEGIVYSEGQNRIAGLDAAGFLAYRAFDAGASLNDLPVVAGAGPTGVRVLRKIFALSRGRFPQSVEANEQRKWPALAAQVNANVQVHGIPIRVECFQDISEALCQDCFLSCPHTTQFARFRLRLHHTATSLSISINDQAVFPLIQSDQAGLGMLHAVRSLLYDEAEYDVAFHAAMVADSRHGMMLCAPRESGKSTLTAYLAAQGFTLVTDEPALLLLDTASISPVETPISLKEGAWKLFEDEWPELADAPVHVRSDRVRIKLLHPSLDRVARYPQRLTHIVFSKYAPSGARSFRMLSPVHTLTRLHNGGMLLGRLFNKDKFEQFLRLICATPAFVVEYSSLKEANLLLQQLLNES